MSIPKEFSDMSPPVLPSSYHSSKAFINTIKLECCNICIPPITLKDVHESVIVESSKGQPQQPTVQHWVVMICSLLGKSSQVNPHDRALFLRK